MGVLWGSWGVVFLQAVRINVLLLSGWIQRAQEKTEELELVRTVM